MALPHSVENGRLALVVHVVGIAAFLDQVLHDVPVTLPSRVEYRGLAVAVSVIGLAPVLQKEPDQVDAAVPGDVEQAGLVEGVLEEGLALCLLDEVLGHFEGLLLLLDEARDEEGVLVVLGLVLQVGDVVGVREAEAGLLLFQQLDATLFDIIEYDGRDLALQVGLLLDVELLGSLFRGGLFLSRVFVVRIFPILVFAVFLVFSFRIL